MSEFRLISSLITKRFYARLSSNSNSILLSLRQTRRNFNNSSILQAQDYYLAKSPGGENYRLHLAKSRHLVGIRYDKDQIYQFFEIRVIISFIFIFFNLEQQEE